MRQFVFGCASLGPFPYFEAQRGRITLIDDSITSAVFIDITKGNPPSRGTESLIQSKPWDQTKYPTPVSNVCPIQI